MKRGRVTDINNHLANGLGMGDDIDGVHLRLLPPGSGPDYLQNRDAWDAEQANIAKQFANNPTAQISPEPETTPWASPMGITTAPPAPD